MVYKAFDFVLETYKTKDSKAKDFIAWFRVEGKSVYTRYLLTLPERWLAIIRHNQVMFNPDSSGYRWVFV